ncbi:trypsin-like peptidase domain-containing protein [Bradyrhizobium sp. 200]|uniref:S1C family serine protease n=1 Tax=Bradyrhizobium sp. 200 TaxID=2782665 RepID=UPI001FFE91DB|nr:trypsin-like peptidase domain-containing protein [Bradyrhizobium sp. 200]UPJ51378.1 trypsin-like peptidase domain-containing protein [Bradyrhizobium sp. 200]
MAPGNLARGNLAFSWRRASMMGGMTVFAIPVIANIAQATVNSPGQASFVGRPATLIDRVAGTEDGGGPGDFADLAEKVQPAVIGVRSKATATRRFGAPEQRAPKREIPGADPDAPDRGRAPTLELINAGSGFFISPDGYAVTSSHVVEDNDTVEIRTSDDKAYSARIIGRDSWSDIALIKVDGRTDFSYVKLSDQQPRVGDWVLTAGNPLAVGGTVTAGIVSARDRDIEVGSAKDFIQIDAPINSGDAGGPSFNTRGDVIGVNSMIFSPSQGSVGVAFAVPADTVKAVIPQLKEKGAVTRGWIGTRVQSVTPELADGLGLSNLRGAIVAAVQDNGPAAKAGLRSGDVITSVGGESVKNANELTRKVGAMAPGSSTQLTVLRQGKESSLSVTLGQQPNEPNASAANPRENPR